MRLSQITEKDIGKYIIYEWIGVQVLAYITLDSDDILIKDLYCIKGQFRLTTNTLSDMYNLSNLKLLKLSEAETFKKDYPEYFI